jgi:hypothetical protein
MCELDFDRVGGILAIILKSSDRPRSLELYTMLLDILDEHSFDHTLVKKCRERISSIDELRTTRPSPCPSDSL